MLLALKKLAIYSALTYGFIVMIMMLLETWLVYPIPSNKGCDWHPDDPAREDVWFDSKDGTQLHGWLFEHSQPEHHILYCHGNGEHVAHQLELMHHLRERLRATVFVFDYRGYGKSEGRPAEKGVIADGLAAQRYLASRYDLHHEQIVVIGRSIGGGVAVAVAAEQGAKALVLQNTFARMVDTAADLYPWLPVRWCMQNRYDSVERIAKYDGPLIQSHGTADTIVPYPQGRQLFEAAPSSRKRWIPLVDLGHNAPQPDEYYDALSQFLEETAGNPSRNATKAK